MANLRVLIPKLEVLEGWATIDDARNWIGLPVNVMEAILGMMGDSKTTHLMLFGACEPTMVRRIVNEVVFVKTVAEGVDEEVGLTPFQRTQVSLIYNAARVKIGLDTVDVLSEPVVPQMDVTAALRSAAQAVDAAAALGGASKVSFAKVLDQAAEGEVERLSEAEVEQYRQHYRSVMLADPVEEQDFTDEQLTALTKWVGAGRTPYTDFAVWRNYGNRTQRDLKFRVQIREANGKYRPIEVSGPSCWEAWETSWLVFKAAAIAMNLATGPTLDLYSQKLKERAREYPQAWYLLMKADIIMRSEEWQKSHRRFARLHTAAPQLSEFNLAMPWECVIRQAALDESYWRKHVETPAMRAEIRQEPPSTAFWAGGLDDPNYSGIEARSKGKNRGNDWGDGGGMGRGKGGDYNNAGKDWGHGGGKGRGGGGGKDWNRGGGGGKGKGFDRTGGPGSGKAADAQRGDGRYFTSVNGTQLCFAYGRNKDGCKKVCPLGRAHACELCRGQHRTIECPKNPGWTPPQKGKGKDEM